MKRLLAAALACVLMLAPTGCKSKDETQTVMADGAQRTEAVTDEALPEKAMEEIYATIDMDGLDSADDDVLTTKFYISTEYLSEYYVTYSNGRYGVADVFFMKPVAGGEVKVRDQLEQVKLSRTKEFESYDIYDAHRIARDAPIFEQGGYLIMLMVADVDGARAIVDKYFPKE